MDATACAKLLKAGREDSARDSGRKLTLNRVHPQGLTLRINSFGSRVTDVVLRDSDAKGSARQLLLARSLRLRDALVDEHDERRKGRDEGRTPL